MPGELVLLSDGVRPAVREDSSVTDRIAVKDWIGLRCASLMQYLATPTA